MQEGRSTRKDDAGAKVLLGSEVNMEKENAKHSFIETQEENQKQVLLLKYLVLTSLQTSPVGQIKVPLRFLLKGRRGVGVLPSSGKMGGADQFFFFITS